MSHEQIDSSSSNPLVPASTINLTETLYQPTWRPADSRPAQNQQNKGRVRGKTFTVPPGSGHEQLTLRGSSGSRDKTESALAPLLHVSKGIAEREAKQDTHEGHLPPVTMKSGELSKGIQQEQKVSSGKSAKPQVEAYPAAKNTKRNIKLDIPVSIIYFKCKSI